MRVFCKKSNREAKLIKGKNDRLPVYKCWLHGGGNKDENSIKFRTIREAAEFLKSNRGSGIRVAAIGTKTGQRTAILHSNLAVEYPDGRIQDI